MKGKESQNFFFRFPMMVLHLMKVSPHGRFAVFADSLRYLTHFLLWRISLGIVRPLNFLRESSFSNVNRRWICRLLVGKYFIGTEMPVNLKNQDYRRFEKNFYLLKPLSILHLKDHWIYLTGYHGITFKNFRILPESIHGKWDIRNVVLLKEYYPLVMNAWMYAYQEKDCGFTELNDDRNYLLAHHWFNYYHWLTETVLRLWVAKEKGEKYVILLPLSFKSIQFVQQSLEALDLADVQYVKEGILRVKNLTLVENKPYCNHYFPSLSKQIGTFFSEYVKDKKVRIPDIGDRIFISREKADRRKLVNENEVVQALSAYQFKSVAIEDLDFFQEVAILSKSKYLIGMHGAGLTNMMFMPQGSRVLELHREVYSYSDLHSDVYWKLASALGHKYYYQFCEPANKKEDFFTADYHVDLKKLKANVELLLK